MSKKKRKKKKKQKHIQVAPAPAEKRDNFDQMGLNHFQRGNYREAVKTWRKASSSAHLTPKLAEACFRDGLSLYKSNQVVQALSSLHQAIQYDPENALYRFHLGLAYHRKGNMDKAISWYEKALEADPKNTRFRYHLGIAHVETDALQRARDQFSAIEDGDLYSRELGLVAVLFKEGQNKEALKRLENIGKHSDPQLHALKGLLLVSTKRGQTVRKPLRSAATEAGRIRRNDPWIEYYLGLSYAADGHFPSAAKMWEQALNGGLDSRLVEADLSAVYHRLAAKEVEREAFDKAIATWEKILKLRPQDAVARDNVVHGCFLMGNRYSKAGNLKKAIQWWTRVVDLDPKNVDVVHNLALAYDRLGDIHEANRYWTQVTNVWRRQRHADKALSGMLHVAHRHLAENHLKMDQPEKAASEYQKAVRYQPEDIHTWLRLGELQFDMGKSSAAVRTLERARTLDAQNTDCLNTLAMAYCERADCRRALRCWQEVMRIDPDHPVASEQLVECVQHQTYMAQERGGTAHTIRIIRETIELCPKQMRLYSLLGELYLKQEKSEEAAEVFAQAIAADPEKPDACIAAGHTYLMAHREAEAKTYFEQAIARAPEDPDLLILIGSSYGHAGNFKTSGRYFQRAIDLAPEDAGIPLRVGTTLLESDFPEQAISYINVALHLSPEMAQAHFALGLAYFKSDNYDKADKALNQAMKQARKDKDSRLIEFIKNLRISIKIARSPLGRLGWL